MKKKNILIIIMTICIFILPLNVYAESNVNIEYKKAEQKVLEDTPEIGCKAAYVAEPTTGKIIYEKNAHEKRFPASTTKILTALLALEKCELTDKAIVSQNALDLVPAGYSNAGLKVGEELDIKTLLYALLIPSANEAANVLAEHISGSVESFAELCNNRAEELGCETLHFVNPNGIHDEEHYCSAYDLYLIAKECRKYDVFNEIVKTKSFTVPATNVYPKKDRTYKNTNSLIQPNEKNYYYEYCTGIKTGHTTPAGECLVASSSYNDIDLISVVLGGGTNSKGLNERFYDTKQLFEFTYDNYSLKQIANKNQVITNINVNKATKETAELDIIIDTDIKSIAPIDMENIEKTFILNDNIEAPIMQNDVLGKVTFKADGLNYTANIVASHNVEKIPYWIYNSIFVGAVLLIIIIITVISKKSKKHRRRSLEY